MHNFGIKALREVLKDQDEILNNLGRIMLIENANWSEKIEKLNQKISKTDAYILFMKVKKGKNDDPFSRK